MAVNYFENGEIPCVESHKDMQDIGKQIVEIKSDIYTQRRIESLISDIRTFLKSKTCDVYDIFYETVYNYWVFGCNISEWFRYDFFTKSSAEKDEYFTMKNKAAYIAYLNSAKDRNMLDDKMKTYKKLKHYYHRDIVSINSEDDYKKFLDFIDRHKKIIVKPQDGSLGMGVHQIHVESGKEKEYFNELILEGVSFNKKIQWSKTASILLEEKIEQNDILSSLCPSCVNCVRLTTIRVDDKVHFFYPWIKIGMNGAEATGSYQGGSMDVGIDVNTGILNTYGMSKGNLIFKKHPDTGVIIKEFKIPKWENLLELAEMLSDILPQFRYIGWDFALNKQDEWCVIEANYAGNQEGQWLYKKGLKYKLENLINWQPNIKYWWCEK